MKRYILVQQLLEPKNHPIKIYLNVDEKYVGRKTIPSLQTYPQVSRDHAVFYKCTTTGAVFVKDLNSSNGLFVNGVKVGTGLKALNVEDIVGFGVPSLEERDGFVCAFKEEVVVKSEVIDLEDDESEDDAVARNSNPVMSMKLNANPSFDPMIKSVENGRKHLKNDEVYLENDLQTTSNGYTLNKAKESETLEISRIKSRASDFSSSNKGDNSKHCVEIKDSSYISSALNAIKASDSPESYRIKSCTVGSSSSNKCNYKQHDAEIEHNTSSLNKIQMSDLLNSSKIQSFAQGAGSSSSNSSRHAVEHNNNSLNKIKASEPSRVKFCASDISSSCKVDNSTHGFEHNSTNASVTLQTSSTAKNKHAVDRIEWKECQVILEKCDSENFECLGVKNQFKKRKLEEESNRKDNLVHKKKKRIWKLPDSSDDSDEESISFTNVQEQKNIFGKKNNTTKSVIHNMDKKIKLTEHVLSSSSNDKLTSQDSSRDDFSDTSRRNNSKVQIVEQNSYTPESKDKKFSYSQTEEVIEISDDESYLDSQHYGPIKVEPPDVLEDIDNCKEDKKQILDESENEPSFSGFQDHNDNAETIVAITAYVGSSAQKTQADEVEKNKIPETNLLLECEESGMSSEESDSGSEETSSHDEEKKEAYFSAQLSLGSNIVENSSVKNQTSAVKDKIGDIFNSVPSKSTTLNKSSGKIVLTDPKPLQQRPRNMRGREEGFEEQKKYQKPSMPTPKKQPQRLNKSVKPSPKKGVKASAVFTTQIGNANSSLNTFKIPRKSEVRNKIKQLNKNGPSTSSKETSSANSRHEVSITKKVTSVKTRPEKFGSRMGFLVEDLKSIPPKIHLGFPSVSPREKKQTAKEVKLDNPKGIKRHSAEKQNNCNLIQVTIQDTSLPTTLNDKSKNNITKNTNKSLVPLNSSILKNLPEYSNANDQSTSNVSKPSKKSPVPLNSMTKTPKSSRWDDPFMRNVSKTPNKAPVPSNRDILMDVSKHTRSSDPCTSDISLIRNNAIVPINPRDPRQNKTKILSNNDIVKTRAQQVQSSSLIGSSTSKLITSIKTKGFKKPSSSNKTSICKDIEINYLVLAKKLINLKCIWLQEQSKVEEPPPDVQKGAANLPLHFASFDEYASYFYPMMMLEIWDCMYTESKEIFKDNRAFNKFYFSLLSYTSKIDCIELKCESIIAEKVSYSPREGSLVILELKDETLRMCQPLFGYIFKHSVDKLNMSSLKISGWQKLPKEWLTNAKHWTFYAYVKKKDMSFSVGSLMKGNGICYIRSKLRLADALGQVKNSPLLQGIIKPNWPEFTVNYPKSLPQAREYTSCQMRVINGIFSEIVINSKTQPKIVLVQGPPGTGKTHTIIGLLEKLVFECEKFMRILLVAPSNAAVDEIGCRLIDLNEQHQWRDRTITFVRVGSEKQIHDKILPYFLDRKAREMFKHCLTTEEKRRDKDLNDLQKEITQYTDRSPTFETNERLKYLKNKQQHLKQKCIVKDMDYHTEMSNKATILKKCHIVLSTLNSCGLSILNRTFKPHSSVQFSCCIMDESTQCTELEVLQPLMFGIDKLVLVGDHEQLPATVTSKLACKFGYKRSMFERFHLFFDKYHHRSPVFTLTEQFRMHSQICEFPSKHFYNKKLETDPGIDIRYSRYPINPYVVLDIIDSQESSESSSKLNCYEASVIISICKSLLDVIDTPSSIGIITPYQGQRSLYEKALHQNPNYKAIEVNTVDGFQGREKEVIIMSCVRANSQSGGIGFLACRNRLNVAITRAKKCLIICCHASSLKANSDWRSLINDAQERKVLFSVTSPKDIPHLFEKYIKKNV